jgi:hypothetical protein
MSEWHRAMMDSTTFEFSLRMPGDPRLVDAVRDLAVHAAAYMKLASPAAEALAAHVAAATRAAVEATPAGSVDVRFTRRVGTFTVSIGLDTAQTAAWPQSAGQLIVETSREGGRETCRISQAMP